MRSAASIALLLAAAGAPAFAANHGALVYDRGSGAWGASYDYPSQRGADAEALRQCARFSKHCTVVVQFWNTCAAYATGDGTSYGWGASPNRRNAQQRALAECSKRGARCEVQMSACTSQPPQQTTSGGPYQRPRYSCWYPDGSRVPDCRD